MRSEATWRETLGAIIQDPQERQRIAHELAVNPTTLMRWVNNESKPHPQNIRQLLNALPGQRKELLKLIVEEFPELSSVVREGIVEDQPLEISSEFYAHVINTYLTTPKASRFWSVTTLILRQALGQLDPNRTGMALTIAQCIPPSHGNKVRSLRESRGMGTPPWPDNLEGEAIFLGAESLAGFAVTTLRSIVLQKNSNLERRLFPSHWVEWEESAAAYPIVSLGNCVGCLIASSTQQNYFSPSHQALLQNFAALLAFTFEPEDFYEPQDIDLQPMPFYRKQEAYFSNFRQRVSDVMVEAARKRQPISLHEAEQVVWQQLEDELLNATG